VGKVFVGHDWAEAHHDVHVEDAEGRRLAKARLPEGVEGVARFHELVAPFVEDPAEVVIATETDRGLFVGAMVAAGYTVLAVNPMSTSRYRERHSTSGAKSDPGDALVLAELAPPMPTTTGPSPATATWPRRSRCWPGPTSR
jgi:transposase